MYTSDFQSDRCLLVCRLARGGDELSDFGTHLERMASAVEEARAKDRRVAILVLLEPGHTLPSSEWRKRIAEVTGRETFKPYLVIVTKNPLARGVLTALAWLRPRHYEENVCESPEEGVAWLEQVRGEPLPELLEMIRKVRGQPSRSTA